jgi:hypothetical protein
MGVCVCRTLRSAATGWVEVGNGVNREIRFAQLDSAAPRAAADHTLLDPAFAGRRREPDAKARR